MEGRKSEKELKVMNEEIDEGVEQLRQQLLYNQQFLEQEGRTLHFQQY